MQSFNALPIFILQNMSQYNQPIYVSSSSSQSLNQPPPQQQQQMNNAPIPNQNGPIYVSSNVVTQPGMMMAGYAAPNHASEQGTHITNSIHRTHVV